MGKDKKLGFNLVTLKKFIYTISISIKYEYVNLNVRNQRLAYAGLAYAGLAYAGLAYAGLVSYKTKLKPKDTKTKLKSKDTLIGAFIVKKESSSCSRKQSIESKNF